MTQISSNMKMEKNNFESSEYDKLLVEYLNKNLPRILIFFSDSKKNQISSNNKGIEYQDASSCLKIKVLKLLEYTKNNFKD